MRAFLNIGEHMQIGKIKLDAPLALAPMAGITDLPFRVICRRLGCGMTVSEMVSAKGLLYKNSINKSPHNSGLVDNDKLK